MSKSILWGVDSCDKPCSWGMMCSGKFGQSDLHLLALTCCWVCRFQTGVTGMDLKEGVDLAGAVGSVAVAIVTGVLAWATFRMAKYTLDVAKFTRDAVTESRDEAQLEERRHQENLRPYCVIEFAGADERHPFGANFTPMAAFAAMYPSTPPKPEILIKGRLMNKGLGPATNVVVYLNKFSSIEGTAYWLTHPIVVSGIVGAGESVDVNVEVMPHNVAMKTVGGAPLPPQVLETVAVDTQEVVLRYRDVFGKTFRTVHARGFPQNLALDVAVAAGDRELRAKQSTRQNRPTPVFLTDEQPWLELADMPNFVPELSVNEVSSLGGA